MITCHVRYIIDPYKEEEFETYARMWLPLVKKFGGTHHGYFLPHESANNVAHAFFSFSSLAEYEQYRFQAKKDPECLAAFDYANKTKCVISYERQFLRPITPDLI